jgi:hypothetical protein
MPTHGIQYSAELPASVPMPEVSTQSNYIFRRPIYSCTGSYITLYVQNSAAPLFRVGILLLSFSESVSAGTGYSKQAMSAREQPLGNVCPVQATEHFSTRCYGHPNPGPDTHVVGCMWEERLRIADRVSR